MIKVDLPTMENDEWVVEHFEVDMKSFQAFRLAMDGRPVESGTYTRLFRKESSMHDPVMSDTPAEMRDLHPIMIRAEGSVLINGLGLGVLVKNLLAKPKVLHIDVVETSLSLINLVGPFYEDPRVKIHHADAYQVYWPKEQTWDVAWHDIWDNICSDNWGEMRMLKQKYRRKVTWQGCWCEDQVRRLVRRERRRCRSARR